jgi:hypothetical protein
VQNTELAKERSGGRSFYSGRTLNGLCNGSFVSIIHVEVRGAVGITPKECCLTREGWAEQKSALPAFVHTSTLLPFYNFLEASYIQTCMYLYT